VRYGNAVCTKWLRYLLHLPARKRCAIVGADSETRPSLWRAATNAILHAGLTI
jgi:hypothetical protein